MKLGKIPVVIHLREDDIKNADVQKQLKIDRDKLDHELSRQSGKYVFWAILYCKAAEKVAELRDKFDELEAERFTEYSKRRDKLYEIKNLVLQDAELKQLKKTLREWESCERELGKIEKAFDKRGSMLQSLSANRRREKHNEED